MGDNTTIEWTDATWNPVRGCSIVSKGCTNCYAMRQAHRSHGAGGAYEGLTKLTKGGPVWTGEIRRVPELLEQPLKWSRPRRIFVNSMSDLFHEDVPFEFIDQVFGVMAITTRHNYQLLTKRPQRMLEYFARLHEDEDPVRRWFFPERISDASVAARVLTGDKGFDNCGPLWPLVNVWLGVSVEDQAAADERIPLLLLTPAAVRWISAEPLLGPVDMRSLLWNAPLHWVVAGGESGPGARPMHPDWARSLRDQCAAAGVPFFFKQWGNWAPIDYVDAQSGTRLVKLTFSKRETAIGGPAEGTTPYNMRNVGKKAAGRELDGRTHDEYPA